MESRVLRAGEEQRVRLSQDYTSAMRAAARHWQATFDAIGDAIVLVDGTLRIAQANAAAIRLLQCPAHDLIGEPIVDVIERALGHPTELPLAALLRERAPGTHEIRIGSRWIAITMHPVPEDEVSRGEAVCVLADVTARVDHQEALAASEQRYRALVMAAAQVVWTASSDGNVVEEIPSWGAFTGQSRDEYEGQGWIEAIHPEDRANVLRTWQLSIDSVTQFHAEYRLLRHDGSYRQVVTRGIPVAGDDGRIREWVGTCTDVTEQRRHEAAERLLAETTTALATLLDTEVMLSRLVELVLPSLGEWCSISLLDDDGAVGRSASAHVDAAMHSVVRELRTAYGDQRLLPGEHPIARAVRQGASSLIALVRPEVVERIGLDAHHRELLQALNLRSIIGVPLRARGRVVGAITCGSSSRQLDGYDLATAQELARRAALALDNAQLYEASVVANEAKADFLAVMSHELRTPLNAIIGYADLLTSGVMGELTAAQTQSIERLKRSGQHLLSLIDEVLTFSRLEAGKEVVELQPADVALVVADVVTLMEPLAADRALHFDVVAPPGPLIANTDPRRLRQILINLVSNAVKFTEQGGVSLELTMDATTGRLVFQVTDTGIGIAQDHLERVFEPFWQVQQKATRRAGGTGLGLSVVRRLANLLGGDVTAESVVGKGSRFVVWLPTSV
jgi:PAS domain S-box-containing protein